MKNISITGQQITDSFILSLKLNLNFILGKVKRTTKQKVSVTQNNFYLLSTVPKLSQWVDILHDWLCLSLLCQQL